jgi:hypothetical protein
MDEKQLSKHELESAEENRELHERQMAKIHDEAQHQLDLVSEKRLLRKTDLHVVPILFLLFLCAFVDR